MEADRPTLVGCSLVELEIVADQIQAELKKLEDITRPEVQGALVAILEAELAPDLQSAVDLMRRSTVEDYLGQFSSAVEAIAGLEAAERVSADVRAGATFQAALKALQ